MKKWLVIAFSFLALSSLTALAADASQVASPSMDKIDAETKALENQIAQLRAEVAELRASQKAALHEIKTDRSQIHRNRQAIKQLHTETAAPLPQEIKVANSYYVYSSSDSAAPKPASALHDDDEAQFLNALRDRVSIITSPYLGLRSSYNASDLLVNLPSMNEDLVLLQQRQTMETEALRMGLPFGDRPLIMLSGDLLPQLILGNDYQKKSVSEVTLSGAELDLHIVSGSWAAGFLALNYDNSTPTATGLNQSAVNNSRIYVSRGFVTVGNLNAAPIYLTAGQLYAPFGSYANSLVTTPLTQAVGRELVRAATLGYSADGLYAETYMYNGDTYIKNRNTLNEGGVNAGYKNSYNGWKYDFGAGYTSNMADAQGAQSNALSAASGNFQGFGGPNGSEQINSRVPGANLHTEIGYGDWNVNAEYVGAIKAYSNQDMVFNGQGAKPQATHVELDYSRMLFNRPWTFVLAYDHSWQALAYNIPEQSYFAVMSVSIWRDTIESIEFRHDINYSSSNVANANISGGYTPITPAGPERNTVTIQLGLYF